jgi:hypothetical protein
MVQRNVARPKVVVTADGAGVVAHAGARLLTDLAEATGLVDRFGEALTVAGRRAGGHDPGRVAVDVAVMLADGGKAIADMAVLRGQPQLFGPVASDATVWRVLDGIDEQALGRLRMARAAAREVAWAQMAETGEGVPAAKAGWYEIPGLTLDIDASVVISHSEKELASPTWKKTFGFHPIFCFLDNTNEALAAILRQGRAGSNTAADHIEVLDQALVQIPDTHRYGSPILVRADSAGSSLKFLRHLRGQRERGLDVRFTVGVAITEQFRVAIDSTRDWVGAIDGDGELRDGAEVAELTHLIDASGYPEGTRFIVRRERPHPGAQLDLFDTIAGYRHQIFATDTPRGGVSIQLLELRHRGHARVEDRIRCGKDAGFGHFPSRQANINQAWLELALTGLDLIAWTQQLLLDGELAKAEPKRLRYQILHTAARIARTARRTYLRLASTWPWTAHLARAFQRLAALPRPVT